MRLWSISPKYLDQKGLCGLWAEGLLAQKVLMGETKGYKNHPQLERFKTEDISVLGYYLSIVWHEAKDRGYNFDITKIPEMVSTKQLTVTNKQLEYEFKHLQVKLLERDTQKFDKNFILIGKPVHKYTSGSGLNFACRNYSLHNTFSLEIEPHPIFKVVGGGIESWEKVNIK